MRPIQPAAIETPQPNPNQSRNQNCHSEAIYPRGICSPHEANVDSLTALPICIEMLARNDSDGCGLMKVWARLPHPSRALCERVGYLTFKISEPPPLAECPAGHS